MASAICSGVSESAHRPEAVAQHSIDQTAIDDLLAMVPVMPATVLALEALLQKRPVDLNDVADILANDLGAVACLCLICNDEPDVRPRRMTDLIAQWEMHDLLHLLASHIS